MCIAEINLHRKWGGVSVQHMEGQGGGCRERALLFVSKTEAFDRVALRVPARANVLVSVRGDDVPLIG